MGCCNNTTPGSNNDLPVLNSAPGPYISIHEMSQPLTPCGDADCGCAIPESDVECPGNQLSSTSSAGSILPDCFTDAQPVECMTLLGRVGKKLSRLVGEGFLFMCNGVVCVNKDIQLKVSKLWHQWYKPSAKSRPIPGDPNPHPYITIADEDGNLHLVRGLHDEDSIVKWDVETGMWEHVPTTSFPICTKGHLSRAEQLELIGFAPIPEEGGDLEANRCARVLCGNGVVFLQQELTTPPGADENCPETDYQENFRSCVAQVLTFPDDGQQYNLVWNEDDGFHWAVYEGPEQGQQGADGDAGEAGADGADGAPGADGEDGADGLSAYQIAVNYGYEGTVQEWLASLEGNDGDDGTDGLSAYEIAVNEGFVGDEAAWLASLAASATDVAHTTIDVETTKMIGCTLSGTPDGNVTAGLDFPAAAVLETGWVHGASSNAFAFTGSPRRVDIEVYAHYYHAATDTVGWENVAPVLELRRNGTLVATSATGLQLHQDDHTESTNLIRFLDVAPGTNPSYTVSTRREGANTAVLPIIAGRFNAVAFNSQTVVATITVT